MTVVGHEFTLLEVNNRILRLSESQDNVREKLKDLSYELYELKILKAYWVKKKKQLQRKEIAEDARELLRV